MFKIKRDRVSDWLTTDTASYLDNGGTLTAINAPMATDTFAFDVNDSGEIVGAPCNNGSCPGFLDDGTTFTTIDIPGGSDAEPYAINNSGTMVGEYLNANGEMEGFVTTPEPSSLLLLGTGFLGLAVAGRKLPLRMELGRRFGANPR